MTEKKANKKQFMCRLSDDLMAVMEAEARRRMRSKSALFRIMIVKCFIEKKLEV